MDERLHGRSSTPRFGILRSAHADVWARGSCATFCSIAQGLARGGRWVNRTTSGLFAKMFQVTRWVRRSVGRRSGAVMRAIRRLGLVYCACRFGRIPFVWPGRCKIIRIGWAVTSHPMRHALQPNLCVRFLAWRARHATH